MKPVVLSPGVIKRIHAAVDKTYDRVLARFLEKQPGDKRIIFTSNKPRITLPALYQAASREEGARPDEDMLAGLKKIAESYVEAQRARTKAQVVKAVQSWLSEAASGKVKTDVSTVLGGELAGVFGKAHDALHQMADTEGSNARNTGTLNGVIRVNAASGIEDPVIYFVVVRDQSLCDECKRVHLMPDGVTPRLWYLSEVKHGYHKKGEDQPSVGGLHPHCRCSLVTLMPGYGFDSGGSITWVEHDHDALKAQRGD